MKKMLISFPIESDVVPVQKSALTTPKNVNGILVLFLQTRYLHVFLYAFFFSLKTVRLEHVLYSCNSQKEPEFIEYDSNGRPVRKSRKKTVNYSLLDEKDDGCSDSDLEEDLEKWFNVVQDSSASYTAKYENYCS